MNTLALMLTYHMLFLYLRLLGFFQVLKIGMTCHQIIFKTISNCWLRVVVKLKDKSKLREKHTPRERTGSKSWEKGQVGCAYFSSHVRIFWIVKERMSTSHLLCSALFSIKRSLITKVFLAVPSSFLEEPVSWKFLEEPVSWKPVSETQRPSLQINGHSH